MWKFSIIHLQSFSTLTIRFADVTLIPKIEGEGESEGEGG